ncbi:hypothetical protein GGR56DRAFT_680518 [Xylariaceae sp. FL0804]|nr:hypothetical protein GGR56DRAFT_680518 [Xylariaceae sp. FL0804]
MSPSHDPPIEEAKMEDDDETARRLPLSFWLQVGGVGPPPTEAGFRRLASERLAAGREAQAHAAAQPGWLGRTLGHVFGRRRGRGERPPGRRRLMEEYGPHGTKRQGVAAAAAAAAAATTAAADRPAEEPSGDADGAAAASAEGVPTAAAASAAAEEVGAAEEDVAATDKDATAAPPPSEEAPRAGGVGDDAARGGGGAEEEEEEKEEDKEEGDKEEGDKEEEKESGVIDAGAEGPAPVVAETSPPAAGRSSLEKDTTDTDKAEAAGQSAPPADATGE